MPVFTRSSSIVAAERRNPEWKRLMVVMIDGNDLWANVDSDVTVVTNPWMGALEYRLSGAGEKQPSAGPGAASSLPPKAVETAPADLTPVAGELANGDYKAESRQEPAGARARVAPRKKKSRPSAMPRPRLDQRPVSGQKVIRNTPPRTPKDDHGSRDGPVGRRIIAIGCGGILVVWLLYELAGLVPGHPKTLARNAAVFGFVGALLVIGELVRLVIKEAPAIVFFAIWAGAAVVVPFALGLAFIWAFGIGFTVALVLELVITTYRTFLEIRPQRKDRSPKRPFGRLFSIGLTAVGVAFLALSLSLQLRFINGSK